MDVRHWLSARHLYLSCQFLIKDSNEVYVRVNNMCVCVLASLCSPDTLQSKRKSLQTK